MVVERIDQGVEGYPFPALPRPTVEHQEAALACPARHLREQPGLADSGIAGNFDDLRRSASELAERLLEDLAFRLTANQGT
jgi:hypothetical protein